jgi:hypothetical protein
MERGLPKWSHIAALAVAGAVLTGACATAPAGPSVAVMPGAGKPFEAFQTDDAVCRDWASRQTGITPGQAANTSTVEGAAVGTLLGAGLGAAIGAIAHEPGLGAAVGAGAGLLGGTAIGAGRGEKAGHEMQRRYDIAYEQCMASRGNRVPAVGAYPSVPPATPTP